MALHLAVVSRCVGLGPPMPGLLAHDPGEVSGAVARTVVGDHTVDVGDAMGGEPDLGSGWERREPAVQENEVRIVCA